MLVVSVACADGPTAHRARNSVVIKTPLCRSSVISDQALSLRSASNVLMPNSNGEHRAACERRTPILS